MHGCTFLSLSFLLGNMMILTQLTGWTFKVELPSEHSMLLFKGNNSYLRVECRPEIFFYVALYQQFHSQQLN